MNQQQQNQLINDIPSFYHWNLRPNSNIIQYLDQQKDQVQYELYGEFIRYRLDYSKSILLSDLLQIINIIAKDYAQTILNEVLQQLEKLWKNIKEHCKFPKESLNEHYLLIVETQQIQNSYPNAFRIIYLGQPIISTRVDLFQRINYKIDAYQKSRYSNIKLFSLLKTVYDQVMKHKLNEKDWKFQKVNQEQQFNLNLNEDLFQQIEDQLVNHQIYLSFKTDKKENEIKNILVQIKGFAMTTFQKYLIIAVQLSMRNLESLTIILGNIKIILGYLQKDQIQDYYRSIALLSSINCDQNDFKKDLQFQVKAISKNQIFPDQPKNKYINNILKEGYETYYKVGQQEELKNLYLLEEEKYFLNQQSEYQFIKDLIYIEFTHLCQNFTLQTFFSKYYQTLLYEFKDIYKQIICKIENDLKKIIQQLNKGKFIVLKYEYFQQLHNTKLEDSIKSQLNLTQLNKLMQEAQLNKFLNLKSQEILQYINDKNQELIIKLEDDVKITLENWAAGVSQNHSSQKSFIKEWIQKQQVKQQIFDLLYKEWNPHQNIQFIDTSIDIINNKLIAELESKSQQQIAQNQQAQLIQNQQTKRKVKEEKQKTEMNEIEQQNDERKLIQLEAQKKQELVQNNDVKIVIRDKEQLNQQQEEQQNQFIQNAHHHQYGIKQVDQKQIETQQIKEQPKQENQILVILKDAYEWQPPKTKEYSQDQLIEQLNKSQKAFLKQLIGQFSKKLTDSLDQVNSQMSQDIKKVIQEKVQASKLQANNTFDTFHQQKGNDILYLTTKLEIKYAFYKQFWIDQVEKVLVQVYKDHLNEKFIQLQVGIQIYFDSVEIEEIQLIEERLLKQKTLMYEEKEKKFISESNIDTYTFIREVIQKRFLEQELDIELFFQTSYLTQIQEEEEKNGEQIENLEMKFDEHKNAMKIEGFDLIKYSHIFEEFIRQLRKDFRLKITLEIVKMNKVQFNQRISAIINEVIQGIDQYRQKIEKNFRKTIKDLDDTYEEYFNRWKETHSITKFYSYKQIQEIQKIGIQQLQKLWNPKFQDFYSIFSQAELEFKTKLLNFISSEYDQLENQYIKERNLIVYMFIREKIKNKHISIQLNLETFFQKFYDNQVQVQIQQFNNEIAQSEEYFNLINPQTNFKFKFVQQMMTFNFKLLYCQQLDQIKLKKLQESKFTDTSLFEQLKKDLEKKIREDYNEQAVIDLFNEIFKRWEVWNLTNKTIQFQNSIKDIGILVLYEKWVPEFNEQLYEGICQQSLNQYMNNLEKEYDQLEKQWISRNETNLTYQFIRVQVKKEKFNQNIDIKSFFQLQYQECLELIIKQNQELIDYIEKDLIEICIQKMQTQEKTLLEFQFVQQHGKTLLINQFKQQIGHDSIKEIQGYKEKKNIKFPTVAGEILNQILKILLDEYSKQINDVQREFRNLLNEMTLRWGQDLNLQDLKQQGIRNLHKQWKPNYQVKSIIDELEYEAKKQADDKLNKKSQLYDQMEQKWLQSNSRVVYKFILDQLKQKNCQNSLNLDEYFKNFNLKLYEQNLLIDKFDKKFNQSLLSLQLQLQQNQFYKFNFIQTEFQQNYLSLLPIYQQRLDMMSKQEMEQSIQQDQWIVTFMKIEIDQIKSQLEQQYKSKIEDLLKQQNLQEIKNNNQAEVMDCLYKDWNPNLKIQNNLVKLFEQLKVYGVEDIYKNINITQEQVNRIIKTWMDNVQNNFKNKLLQELNNIFKDELEQNKGLSEQIKQKIDSLDISSQFNEHCLNLKDANKAKYYLLENYWIVDGGWQDKIMQIYEEELLKRVV